MLYLSYFNVYCRLQIAASGQKVQPTRHNADKHNDQLVARFYSVTSWPCDELTGSIKLALSVLIIICICEAA